MKKNVVLIDGDTHELRGFIDLLSEINGSFKCSYENSANGAIKKLRQQEADFIFINYELNGVDGLQVLSAIKFEPRLQASKVFIFSEHITDEVIKMARVLGAAGCIEKGSTSTLLHQLKAIFAEELMPAWAMLRGD